MRNHEALAVATARSSRARQKLACQVFWMAGCSLLATLAWQGYQLIPAYFWAVLWAVLCRGYAAYSRFYFEYLWSPVVWGLYAVAAIWIARDKLIALELRRAHQEHPELDREASKAWLHTRQLRWKLVAGTAITAWVTACLGLDIEWGAASLANPFIPVMGGALAYAFSFAQIDLAYVRLDKPLPREVRGYTEARAYEKGYHYGRFNDDQPPPGEMAQYNGAIYTSFRNGVAAGQKMRNDLRLKGIDVDRR